MMQFSIQTKAVLQINKQSRFTLPHTVQSRVQPLYICHAGHQQRPLEVSSSIAAARAAESQRVDALFQDPYAAALSGHHSSSTVNGPGDGGSSDQSQQLCSEHTVMDVIATRYIDESLMNAVNATSINSIQSGDFRQVVLLGDGMDTRPFRLMWPAGTLIFSVAPAEVHEQAEAILAAAQPPAHVMRGCLLRRVNMNLKPAIAAAAAASAAATPESAAGVPMASASAAGESSQAGAMPINTDTNGGSSSSSSNDGTTCVAGNAQQQYSSSGTVFREQLMRAGFRPDRLSVWVLQGLHNQGLGFEMLQQLLAEVADSAAFHSLIVGELPGPLSQQQADNIMAEAGLLGAVYDYETADAGQYKRWERASTAAAAVAHEAAGSLYEAPSISSPVTDADAGSPCHEPNSSSSSSGSRANAGDCVAARWVIAGQQLRLSLEQMGIYDEWSTEFDEADFGDDFIGNVS